MIKKHTMLLVTAVIVACSNADASSAVTAEKVVEGLFKAKEDPATAELLLRQPEVRMVIQCIADHLDMQGWSMSNHEEFMRLTDSTGDLSRIYALGLSDSEIERKLGPVFMASGDCM